MKLLRLCNAVLVAVVASHTCSAKKSASIRDSAINTTSSMIALANVDQQIRQAGNEAGVEELLLVRSRFLGDYEALDRASALGEGRFGSAKESTRSNSRGGTPI
jgi:hypothetical protein